MTPRASATCRCGVFEWAHREGRGSGLVEPVDDSPIKARDHLLVSDPTENPRVWRKVETITCHATVHDTLTAAVSHGCICPDAKAARTFNAKRRRVRGAPNALIDATVTRQQLQALTAAGHAPRRISDATGICMHRLRQIRGGASLLTTKPTAGKINAYWRANRKLDGGSVRAKTEAAKRGWPPPSNADLQLVDEVKVARRLAGDRTVRLNQAEKAAAVRQLAAAHVPASAISVRLGVNSVYIHRYADGAA